MSAPRLLITIGRVHVGVGLQGEKQRDSERRREEARAKQLPGAEKATGKSDDEGDEKKINQILERFGEEKHKSFLDLCAEGEEKKESDCSRYTSSISHWMYMVQNKKQNHLKIVSFSSLHGIYGSTQPYTGFSESG